MLQAAMSPKVTVIVSTYQGGAYLREAIDSVLNQTVADFEFRIMDDGSTDDTIAIVEEYCRKDPRILFSRNQPGRGVGYCYSRLIAEAKGTYFSQIGQDDAWDPKFLEKSIAALEASPDAAATFTGVQILGPKGELRDISLSAFRQETLFGLSEEGTFCRLFKENFLCAMSSVVRRSALKGWSPVGDNDRFQDWDTWLYLSTVGRLLLVPEKLAFYRIHGSNLSLLPNPHPKEYAIDAWHSRLHCLMTPQFQTWIASAPVPEQRLTAVLETLREVMDPGQAAPWESLHFWLRHGESQWREFPIFQAWMRWFYERVGAYRKALRYSPALDLGLTKSLKSKTFIFIGRSDLPPAKFPGVEVLNLGPLKVVNCKLAPHVAPLVSFRLDFTASTLETLIERTLQRRGLVDRFQKVWALAKVEKWKVFQRIWKSRFQG